MVLAGYIEFMTDRRQAVDFDPDYFARRAARGQPLAPDQVFRHAYYERLWRAPESVSGPGSSLQQTARLRQNLPRLLRRWGIDSLLDLPCGDGNWMAQVALEGIQYHGADLLSEVVGAARAAATDPRRHFTVLNLLADDLPSVSLVFCRDCLVHFSYADFWTALDNIRRAKPRYLLTTTFPEEARNIDIRTGDWRPINLQAPPFGFPPPLELLVEGCTEQDGLFADKSLGLWRVADLPTPA